MTVRFYTDAALGLMLGSLRTFKHVSRSITVKRVLLVLVLGVCLAACDSQSSSPTAPSTSTPTSPISPTVTSSQSLQSVTLSVNADAMKSRGDTAQTTPIGTFGDGTSQNVMATCSNWQSDNVSVLTIN